MVKRLITDYFKQNKKTKSYRKTLITDYFKPIKVVKKEKVYGYNSKTDDWHCLICGVSMGRNNPRQLCGKTYCENLHF